MGITYMTTFTIPQKSSGTGSIHKTAETAIAASVRNSEYSHNIIDTAGVEYTVHGDGLV